MSLTKPRRRTTQLASFTLKTLSAAVFAATLMSAANGAGLGRLTVLSALGQPLNAEIELNSIGRDEAGRLSAKLASAEAFRQANIEFNPALSSMRFAVEQRGSRQVIHVTSAQPINEPFVDMLIELGGTNSRLVREYTFLLDPVELRSAQVAIPAVIPAAPIPKPSRASVESTPAVAKAPSESGEVVPTARRPVRAKSEVVAAKSDRGTESYTVRRGDSLAKIANQVRSNGVSLDQMLVAIYRANPNAFVGENMNRMRTGQILTIPAADVVSGIAPAEARGVVVAQAADFSSYRNKLAGQVSASTPQKTATSSQSASGSISTKVEEQKNAANEAKDKLKLSKSGTPTATNISAKVAPGPTAEEQIAKDKAIIEANSRVKELEKNVSDLQNILALKNKNLAELQKKVEIAPKPVPVVTAVPVDKPAVAILEPKKVAPVASTTPAASVASAVSAAPATATPVASAPAASSQVTAAPVAVKDNTSSQASVTAAADVKPPVAASTSSSPSPSTSSLPSPSPSLSPSDTAASTPAAAAAPPVSASKPPKPVATPAPTQAETSFIDDLMGNAFVLPALGLILVALGALGIVGSRRKKKNQQFEDSILTDSNLKANSLFGSTGGQSVDTNNSVFNSNFAPTASHLDANEVDPVAEADVYIAYGRDAQAEEILKEALKTQPERLAVRTKLLEIYATRKDTRSFDLMASELYSMTKGVGEDWQHAASMGAGLDPGNPMYAGAKIKPVVKAAAAFGAGTVAADGLDLQSLLATTQHHDAPSEINTIAPVLEPTSPTPSAAIAAPNVVEHEILALPVDHVAHAANAMPHASKAADAGMDFDLSSFSLPAEQPAAPAAKLVEPANADLNSMNFDMPSSMAGLTAGLAAGVVTKTVEVERHPVPSVPQPTHDAEAVSHGHLDHALVFHNDTPSAEHAAPIPAPALKVDPLDFDLSGISLDLNPIRPAAVATAATGTDHHDLTHNHGQVHGLSPHDTLVMEDTSLSADPEMATKLDLAMAYEEIGDKEGARELLDEVIKGGTVEQIGKAKAMLSAMG